MTGLSGDRTSVCFLRFRIASLRISIERGDPESLGTNRSAYQPRDQSLFV